jgi:hypothetical protein
MVSQNTKSATKPAQTEPISPYDQLATYVEHQKQKLLRCYSLKELADQFTDWYDNDHNALTLADNFLSVGLDYKPAEFLLTGLGIALGRNRDEIVYDVRYKQGDEEKNVILHAETYLARRYTLFNVIEDIYVGLQNVIYEMLPGAN